MNYEFMYHSLRAKAVDNARFGKKYWVKDGFVHKETWIPRRLNLLCIQMIMDYYNDVLNLPFSYEIKKNNRFEHISPIVEVSGPHSGKANPANTNKILEGFLDRYPEYKDLAKPGYRIEVFVCDDVAENYFRYNGEDYLLDLEEFCFCVYDKDGNNVGLDGINLEKYQDKIIPYSVEYKFDKEAQMRDNMLTIH